MRNIYVGNIPFEATEDDLRTLFAAYGQVNGVSLVRDRYSNQLRGFAFVEMRNDIDAQKAISELNGSRLKGRTLVINQDHTR